MQLIGGDGPWRDPQLTQTGEKAPAK